MMGCAAATSPSDVVEWLAGAKTGGVHQITRDETSFVPWPQVHEDVLRVAAHLAGSGVGAGDRVGIRGDNSYQWLVLDLALLQLGALPVAVPVPDFAGRSNAELSDRYGLAAMFAAKGSRSPADEGVSPLETLLELTPLVVRQDVPEPAGERHPQSELPYFTVAFSSGTAGRVKSLLMYWPGLHRLIEATGEAYPLRSGDRIMIALPLSTFQQRFLCYLAIRQSCSIVLTTASRYLHALRQGAPTFLLGPPSFYEFAVTRFANESPRSRRVRRLAATAASVLPGSALRKRCRRLAFQPYHEMFGGSARLMLVGSAPVRRDMLDFFARAGFELHQIYGMTESGYLAWNRPGQSRLGSVGRPSYPGTLLLDDADGEVLVKHPWHICCGYEGEPAEDAASVFRGDGVVATGDLGHLQDGYLYLKGRKKNVFVTAGGRKVSIDEMEEELVGAAGVNRVALIDAPEHDGLALVAWYQGDETIVRSELRSRIANVDRRLGLGSEIRRLALVAGELESDSPLFNRNLKLNRAAVGAAMAGRLEEIS